MSEALNRAAILSIIEQIEVESIARGVYSPIDVDHILTESQLTESQLVEILNDLLSNRRIIFQEATKQVQSRIGSILKDLYFCRTYSRTNREGYRNVADLKYIRNIKRIPARNIPLNTLKNDIIRETSIVDNQILRTVLSNVIDSVSAIYPTISKFQKESLFAVLSHLKDGSSNTPLVLVADTGTGKTLAYQLPLVLWIIAKKIITPEKTTTALLIFPRNMLAKNQYESITDLCEIIDEGISRIGLTSNLETRLKISIKKDFGRVSRQNQLDIYDSIPDVIVTNTETIKRRLMNPICHNVYSRGIDLVLYDEVHLYDGLYGANVSAINARLKNLLPNNPAFLGMSATIANPVSHCQKLFVSSNPPHFISDHDDRGVEYTVEHHIIIKPRSGRPPLGVLIDATSCLIHNRRDGLFPSHNFDNRNRPKTICFVDSLDGTSRWRYQQNDLEKFYPSTTLPSEYSREYPIHYSPFSKESADSLICENCKKSNDIIAFFCDQYIAGKCWWFSRDDGDINLWDPLDYGYHIPHDGIRFKRITSQEVSSRGVHENVYELFSKELTLWIDQDTRRYQNVPIDALISTSVLEVGVDFEGIKEIIQYGEIKSPTSYKQKAGRGAREGNMEDGLLNLAIISGTPLSSFFYRHFDRLVYPSLTPIPLEISNRDTISAHIFSSILDRIANNNIDIFHLNKHDMFEVETEFDKALKYLTNHESEIKDYLKGFLSFYGIRDDELIAKAITIMKNTLEYYCIEYDIEGESHKLISWLFTSTRDTDTKRKLVDDANIKYDLSSKEYQNISKTNESLRRDLEQLCDLLIEIDDSYLKYVDEIKEVTK